MELLLSETCPFKLKNPVSYYRVLSCGRTQDFLGFLTKKERRCDSMSAFEFKNGKLCKPVFCKYIKKNGKIIYPKKAKVFVIWVPVDSVA